MGDFSLGDRYASLARRGGALIARDDGNSGLPPVDVDPRWGLSAVLRLPNEVAGPICEFGRCLRTPLGPAQIFYPEHELHTTLCSFEAFQSDVPPDGGRVKPYAEILSDLTVGNAPIEIEHRGVLASTAGIVVAGWPADTRRLDGLRNELHRRLALLGSRSGPERERLRDLYHASLAVFVGPIDAPDETLRLLRENSDRRFGRVAFGSIEIISYRVVPGQPPQSSVLHVQRFG